jgi:hypothetical protein
MRLLLFLYLFIFEKVASGFCAVGDEIAFIQGFK